MVCVLVEDDVRQLLTMPEAIKAVEDAFLSLAANEATNFPRQRSARPKVTLNVLCAISHRLDAAGVKVYPIVGEDATVGSSFIMLVYSVSQGALVGLLKADSLGQIRTGAASAVASRYLARPDSRIMTLFGAGWQAESQAEAIACIMPSLELINVISRSHDRAQQFCHRMAERIGPKLEVARDIERAVRNADIVTTATGSRTPVFEGGWLSPGTHINAVGSNFADKQEIDLVTVRRATRIVVDDLDVARIECGDLLTAGTEVELDWSALLPLANVVVGSVSGRCTAEDITLFESHGMGLEDLAAACRALALARVAGVGQEISMR